MKKVILLTLTVFGLLLSSCEKDPINPNKTYLVTETTVDGVVYNKVEGIINENFTMNSDKKWMISGGVFVDEGVTLTINGGQTINADPSVTTFLSIKQGGKIMAEGSPNNPIVLTPLKSDATYGDWGGIIINGKLS